MLRFFAVVDTNVLISPRTSRDSPRDAIIRGMLRGSFPFLLSSELIAEYREVLRRPEIVKRHGRSEEQLTALLADILANAAFREPPPAAIEPPDASDAHLFALAASVEDAILVTGDRALLDAPRLPFRVMSPRKFVAFTRPPARPPGAADTSPAR
jgi:putative PIN family toxin of toxin-antitoxin system